MEACLERIGRLDPSYRAFIAVDAERARAEAGALDAERGRAGARGLLHGLPIAVKDNVDVAGFVTTAGSRLHPAAPAPADAPCVAGLRAAGAIVLGKTNLEEYAYGFTTQNPHYGTARNPWNPSRVAGGSSGGSAVAVALGLCAAAVGTDTNGSLRVPAAYCGLVGLRPTYGRVSLDGVVPLAASYEQAGPIGRTVRDVRLLLAAMAARGGGAVAVPGPLPPSMPGRSPSVEPPTSWSPAGSPSRGPSTFAVAREAFLATAEEPVRVTVERALDLLAAAGHELREVRLPRTARGTLATAAITSRESAVAVPDEALARGEGLGKVARERLASRHAVSDEALREARAAVDPIREELLAVLEHADVVACATSPLLAPRIEDTDRPSPVPGLALGRYIGHFTAPFGLAGLPCLSLPCGRSPEGLPVGLQLVGRPWEEDRLLAVAEVVEQALAGVRLGLPWGYDPHPDDGAAD